MTVTASQLKTAVDSLVIDAGTVFNSNENESGRWLEFAEAAEELAGASTAANSNPLGYMKRAAVALETLSGTSGAEENSSYSGYLKRIVDALEALGGVGVGSLGHRLVLAVEGAVFSTPAAAWPSLIGAEMMVNGDCSSGTGWGLGVGATIAADKLTLSSYSLSVTNDGVQDVSFVDGAIYRNAFTVDTVSVGSVAIELGSSVGTSRSTTGTFSQDLAATDPLGEGGWRLVCSSATMQLDNFSVKSVGLLGVSSYWTMPASNIVWDAFTQGIIFGGAGQADIVSITGDGLTAFAAAVSPNTAVLFRVYIGDYTGGDASVSIHNGSWVALSIGADGWSTPVAATTGAVAGLDFRGNVGSTAEFNVRACDIDLA